MTSAHEKSSFLRRAGRFINRKLLTPFGVAVTIVERPKWLARNRIVKTQVGRYSIEVPSINPFSWYYALHPNYASQLGRLTSQIKKKYPTLAAIDIGANVGDTVCIMKTAEDIPILCIEGDDYTFGILERNIRQFRDTTAHKLFLGEKTGMIAANFEKVGWNTTIQPDNTNSAPLIKISSLDDFLATQSNLEDFKLLKIDTEGFDCTIIRGAKSYVRKIHPVITFEYNRENMDAIGESGIDTLIMLSDLGYSQIVYHDDRGRFLCTTCLSEGGLLKDLHNYADGKHGAIYYFDITVFHASDGDIASRYVEGERQS